MYGKATAPLASLVILLASISYALGQDASTRPPRQETTIPVSLFKLGEKYSFPDMEVSLDQVVPGGTNGSVTGPAFTEYKFTIKNLSPNRKLLVSDIAVKVGTDVRRKMKTADDIRAMRASLSNMTETEAAAAGVAISAGAAAAMLAVPIIGWAISGLVMAEPFVDAKLKESARAWQEELVRRTFRGETKEGITLFPSEAITGSDWFRQARGEIAEEIHLYVEVGGDARLVKITPPAKSVE